MGRDFALIALELVSIISIHAPRMGRDYMSHTML